MTPERAAHVAAVAARVKQDIKDHPSVRPYLGEKEAPPPRVTCAFGHAAMVVRADTGKWRCGECARIWKRERRKRGRG